MHFVALHLKASICIHVYMTGMRGVAAHRMLVLVQAESDIAASLTAWGRWQPALAPGRGPSVAEALVGSLGGKDAERRVSITYVCWLSDSWLMLPCCSSTCYCIAHSRPAVIIKLSS